MKFCLLTPTQNQVRKLAMLDYFEEEEEEEQQQEASAEVTITNNGQRNQPTALPSVFFSRPKKGHSVQVHQMRRGPVRGTLFRGISHKSKYVIYHPVCEYCVS